MFVVACRGGGTSSLWPDARGERSPVHETALRQALRSLCSGPYKCNGVPLRRVNQSYVIATSTVVDVSKVKVGKFDDAFFEAEKKGKNGKKSEEGFFEKDGDEVRNHTAVPVAHWPACRTPPSPPLQTA